MIKLLAGGTSAVRLFTLLAASSLAGCPKQGPPQGAPSSAAASAAPSAGATSALPPLRPSPRDEAPDAPTLAPAIASAPGPVFTVLPSTPECVRHVQLNSFSYTKNTLVYADCVVIPDGTEVKISPNITLFVVSLAKTTIGKNVSISTKGNKGPRGDDGRNKGQPMQHTEYTNAKLAGCHAGRTGPGESNYDLVGKVGKKGLAGGHMKFALSGLILDATLKLINQGGDGGDPGASGHLRCWCTNDCSDQDHCHDGENSDGSAAPREGQGPEGDPDPMSLATFGVQASPALDTLVAVTTRAAVIQHKTAYAKPSERADFIRLEVKPLTDLADKESWDKIPPPK